jgi:hypothetical protein
MSNRFFDELISEETIAKLTDEMLRKKNEYKINKKLKYRFIKILPAAISIALCIGFINIISDFPDNGSKPDREPGKNSNIFLTEPAIEPAAGKLTGEIIPSSFYIPSAITIEFSTEPLAAEFIQMIEPTIDKSNELSEEIPPTDSQFSTV